MSIFIRGLAIVAFATLGIAFLATGAAPASPADMLVRIVFGTACLSIVILLIQEIRKIRRYP